MASMIINTLPSRNVQTGSRVQILSLAAEPGSKYGLIAFVEEF